MYQVGPQLSQACAALHAVLAEYLSRVRYAYPVSGSTVDVLLGTADLPIRSGVEGLGDFGTLSRVRQSAIICKILQVH